MRIHMPSGRPAEQAVDPEHGPRSGGRRGWDSSKSTTVASGTSTQCSVAGSTMKAMPATRASSVTAIPSIQRWNSKWWNRTRTRKTRPMIINGYQASHRTSANVG